MVIGENSRADDMDVNITKEKKLTNMRSSTSDSFESMTPPRVLTLEESLEFARDDECVEVTPRRCASARSCSTRPSAAAPPRARSARTAERRGSLMPAESSRAATSRDLVDEFVEVADLLHQRICDLLHSHTADHTRDLRGAGMQTRTREEVTEVRLRGEVIREFLRCIPSAIV
jgi:hypothetical protein